MFLPCVGPTPEDGDHIAAVNDAPDALGGVKSYAFDPENAARLWAVSEQLVGERFALT